MAERLLYHEGGSELLRRNAIREYLEGLKDKRAFDRGDLVTTMDGPYANQGLMVVEKKGNGTVMIAPAPNTVAIPMQESQLWHFEDFHDAFRAALQKYPYSMEELFSGDKK
ncbi:MAG: hypothetical protein WC348_00710 [Patescibacteria group bacterium]|jgi:hypothetical protein